MAYDTVQRLLAIGNGHGVIRVIGDVGVDYCLKHESDAAVLHIQFLINEVCFIIFHVIFINSKFLIIKIWNFLLKLSIYFKLFPLMIYWIGIFFLLGFTINL